jgi:hypothetical protein
VEGLGGGGIVGSGLALSMHRTEAFADIVKTLVAIASLRVAGFNTLSSGR